MNFINSLKDLFVMHRWEFQDGVEGVICSVCGKNEALWTDGTLDILGYEEIYTRVINEGDISKHFKRKAK